METGEGGADCETAETGFGDGAIYDSLLAEAVEEAFCDFVSAGVGLSALSSSMHSRRAFLLRMQM
jgi:hypothetical protein